MDLLRVTLVPHLYLRASALPCGVGGNKNLSIVSFIMVQTQGRFPAAHRATEQLPIYGWIVLCHQVAVPAAEGLVFCSLLASVGAVLGQLAVNWLRCAQEAIFLRLGAVPAVSGEKALTSHPKKQAGSGVDGWGQGCLLGKKPLTSPSRSCVAV